MSDCIFKVWGLRKRILLTDTTEIDLLTVKKDCFCSLHHHTDKINFFYIIKGKVTIETEFGEKTLKKGESFTVNPPLRHRFIGAADSEMIEIAFTSKGKIDEKDIKRIVLGGKILEGKKVSIPELKKRGFLNLYEKN